MTRKSLKTLYHIDSSEAEKEYDSRFHSENAIHLPLKIGCWPAFLVFTPQISRLIHSILVKNTKLIQLSILLPNLSLLKENFLLSEIEMSNDIEGVYSSKKMLKEAWEQKLTGNSKFSGLVRQYGLLLEGEHPSEIKTCQDIRNAYDLLLLSDIQKEDKENVPDGKLFRAKDVGVYSGMKQIHCGLYPETKIIEVLQSGLDYVNHSEDDLLIKIAFLHFLVGYVHPFYDGNGRINRFLSTVLLEQQLDLLSILQLSYMIRNHRKEYYAAFELAENPLNKGELTEFVLFFLDMLDQSASHALCILTQKKEEYEQQILKASQFAKLTERNIYEILLSYSLFSFQGIRKKEFAEKAGCSENTVVNFVRNHKELVYEERDGKFKRYSLNLPCSS